MYLTPDDLWEWANNIWTDEEETLCFIYGPVAGTSEKYPEPILTYEAGEIHSNLMDDTRWIMDVFPDASRLRLSDITPMALLGRCGFYTDYPEDPDTMVYYLSFWNKDDIYDELLPGCLRELRDLGLIENKGSPIILSTPFEVRELTGLGGETPRLQHTELSPEKKWELELLRKMHIMRGDEKKRAMRQLGLGWKSPGAHPWAQNLSQKQLLVPGAKWWAPYSEGSTVLYFDRVLDEALLALDESLESKLPMIVDILTNKKSHWRGKDKPNARELAADFATTLAEYDPSSNQRYVRYIAKQVAMGQIRLPEDGSVIKDALEVFITKRKDWPGFKDVFQYKGWRDLQADAMKYKEATSKLTSNRAAEDQLRALARDGTQIIVDDIVQLIGGGSIHFKVYKCTNYASPIILGKGTQWCTGGSLYDTKRIQPNETVASKVRDTINNLTTKRSWRENLSNTPWAGWGEAEFLADIYKLNGWPQGADLGTLKAGPEGVRLPNAYFLDAKSNAESYIQHYGGMLYIIYKDDKPYIQATGNGTEIRNIEDIMLAKASRALARILVKISKADDNEKFLHSVSDMIRVGMMPAEQPK